MSAIKLTGEDVNRGPLILVNANHLYAKTERRAALVKIRETELDVFAACALSRILAMTEFQYTVIPFDGYRSLSMQRELYSNSLRENGESFTKNYVAPPGASEHHTGLAIDMAKACDDIDPIRPDFPYTGACGKFRSTAVKYGFVERYKRGKEHITGIAHEPWHFRFVGCVHAHVMEEHGMSLEEYVDFLRDYDYADGNCFETALAGRSFRIGFVPCDGQETVVNVPLGTRCKVSGNNVDGFVACCWQREHHE